MFLLVGAAKEKGKKRGERSGSNQKGSGLLELLIAIGLFSILIVGVLYLSYESQTQTYEVETRKIDVRRNLQQIMEDITRELRMAQAITSVTANTIQFTSVQDGDTRSFSFSASNERLTYTKGSSSKTFTGVSQFTVTTYPSMPNKITISLQGKTVHRNQTYYQALSSDVTMRNIS